jgi:hypothetical protein
MRALVLFIIGLAFGSAFGILISGHVAMPAHDHAGHSDAMHDHDALTAWPADTPSPHLMLKLHPDGPTSRNLQIITHGFTWTPEEVNGPITPGGHAHVYVNGEKISRAYGEWLHLAQIPEQGPITIRVTLNANDHTGWSIDGQPLAAEITVP